eukprot:366038-Chlamydomonas_euryale.AAC.11
MFPPSTHRCPPCQMQFWFLHFQRSKVFTRMHTKSAPAPATDPLAVTGALTSNVPAKHRPLPPCPAHAAEQG